MEFITGGLFAFSYYMLGFGLELVVAILFMSLLVIITVSDIAYMLIPNKVLLPFAVVLFACKATLAAHTVVEQSPRCGSGFWHPLPYCSRVERWNGRGGHQIVFRHRSRAWYSEYVADVISCCAHWTIIGLFVLKRTGQGRKTPIPFGPSIALAAVIAYFWGRIHCRMVWKFV